MRTRLLPLGTVVKLRGTEKAMMICGYCAASKSNLKKLYDYSGFPYPEGYVDTYKIYQFNAEQIEDVLAWGYEDREAHIHLARLSEKMDVIREQLQESDAMNEKK